MATSENKIEGELGSIPRCGTCGSERVVKDAWACWNPEGAFWQVETVFDHTHCHQCEGDTKLQWIRAEPPDRSRVRELNDQLRTEGRGNGSVFVTAGVQALGEGFVSETLRAVRTFDQFSEDNDPWGEHDFGTIEIQGEKVFFKIDYYDPSCSQGSEDPANEGLTHRVLTIMLASEY